LSPEQTHTGTFSARSAARTSRRRSTRKRIQSYSFHIADKRDLGRMKEIAVAGRGLSADLQDLECLKSI
jgi:hypothetical protein